MDRPATPLKVALPSLFGAAFLLLLPSFLFGPLPVDSAILNAVWTEGFARALREGQSYPRWLAGSFEGLGAPTFYFYPPIAFYLAGGLHALGFSTGSAINGAAFVGLLGSGLSMFAFLRARGGPALLGALVYMVGPYHLTDFYIRAALAEFTAFVWLPLIAMGLEAWPKRWAAPLLAASLSGLCMTHLPIALLTGLFLIVPLVAWKTRFGRDLPRLAAYACAGVAGLAMAAIYIVPALTLEPFMSAAILRAPFFQPDNWSLFGNRAIVAAAFSGWPIPLALASTIVACGAAWMGWRQRREDALVYSGVCFAAAAMGLGLIPGVWRLPLLDRVQFPWRSFAVMEFAAISASASLARTINLGVQGGAVFAIAVYVRIGAIFFQIAGNYTLPPDRMQRMSDAPEYLPAGFPLAGFDQLNRDADLSGLRGPEATGPVAAAISRRGGGLDVTTRAAGRVMLRRFAFPGWTVTSQAGQRVATTRVSPAQLLAFDAPSAGTYRLRREPLQADGVGLALSLAGLAMTLAMARSWSRHFRTEATRPTAAPSGGKP